jgi:two-component system cell cycle response regulator
MPRRLLLIDDDRLQFRLTQAHVRNFRAERYDLEWASNYGDGLDKLLTGDFAACLLDFQLGERDGLQLIREAVSRGCRTPIVFLTAESSSAIDIEAMNAGALDYLVKGELTPAALERSLRYAVKLGETLDELHRLATHDELTGLVNRRELDRVLEEQRERAVRLEQPLGLIMCDIDHFKAVNDVHGHAAGDAVLREVASRLRTQLRAADVAGRFGGEEFAVLVAQGTLPTAAGIAERIRECVMAAPICLPDGPLAVTISLGVAVLPPYGMGGPSLLSGADQALYRAKRAGRNRVECAGP